MRNNIQKARLNINMTQTSLAKQIGISRPQLSQIEHGVYNPSLRVALKISEILKISVNDLFKLEKKDWEKKISNS